MYNEELVSKDGSARIRQIDHHCGDDNCETCQQDAVSYYIQVEPVEYWMLIAVLPKSIHGIITQESLDKRCDDGGLDKWMRLAILFGVEWEQIEENETQVFVAQGSMLDVLELTPGFLQSGLTEISVEQLYKIREEGSVLAEEDMKRLQKSRTVFMFAPYSNN